MPLQQQRQQTQHQQLAPTKPVFGVSLDDIFRRDDTPIPYVVSQCTMAVEMFGLDVEGIYRLSGNASHVTQLKAVFDSGEFCCSLLTITRFSEHTSYTTAETIS